MTRKLFWSLFVLIDLTTLPGCQNFFCFGKTDEAPPHKVAEQVQTIPENNVSTAVAREEDRRPTTKLPPGPSHEVASPRPEPKKNDGVTGTVMLEADSEQPPKDIAISLQPQPIAPLVEKKSELEPAALALDFMLKGRHAEAIKCLSTYEDDKQQVLLRFMPALTIFVKKRIDELSAEDIAVLNQQFHSLLDQLRPRSELVIAKMCYCKEVHNFASYEALPDQHPFLAGTPDRIGELVQLYVELKNFASEPTKAGDYLTKLNCSLELLDSAGKQVMSKTFDGKQTTMVRRARMNDFYTRYGFYVPALPAGVYQLRLRIADETNPENVRVASKSLEFRVTPIAE